MNITKDAIKSAAELYAEEFRLIREDDGWFQQKVNDFTAGYNACQQLLQQTACSTLRKNYEQMYNSEQKAFEEAIEYSEKVKHSKNMDALIVVIMMVMETQPVA